VIISVERGPCHRIRGERPRRFVTAGIFPREATIAGSYARRQLDSTHG
jgi:hypothetical protein